jgi:hypothetical protein
VKGRCGVVVKVGKEKPAGCSGLVRVGWAVWLVCARARLVLLLQRLGDHMHVLPLSVCI